MMSAESGAAKNTLDAYERDLSDYLAFIKGREVSTALIRDYLAALHAQDLKHSSIARKLSSIKSYHRFLYAEGLVQNNPAANLKGAKKQLLIPQTLSVKDVDKLLTTAEDMMARAENKRDATRIYCLLELLYATGLRISELVALPRSAATSRDMMLRVIGKGNKERLVPLHGKAREAMVSWLEFVGINEAFLFPAKSDTGFVARQVVARDLKALAGAAGLSQELSPHLLRHAFASHLLQNGVDLRSLQMLLGHADISTTQIYTHVLDDRLEAMVHDLHPLGESE